MKENRSRFIFTAGTLISGVLLLQMGLYILGLWVNWNTGYNIFEICQSLLRAYRLEFAGYVLQAIVYQTFFVILFMLVKQAVLFKRFTGKLKVYKNEALTRRMNQRYSEAQGAVTVISSPVPIAMVTGFFKPAIVLSTGLMKLLSKDELRAVLHHEWYHAKSADPVKTFLLSLFANAMWYIPVLKWFLRNYQIVREVLADDYAIRQTGSAAELGGALLKLLKGGVPARMPMSHVSITDSSVNYRIKQILDPQAKLELKWPLASVLISIPVVAVLCTLFIILH